MSTSMREYLFCDIAIDKVRASNKITIVGAGAVGLACAYSIINQSISSEICLIDIPQLKEKLAAEVADLQHGSAFGPHISIFGGTDYALTAHSTLVVITAGVRQSVGESRLSLVSRNYDIFSKIVPQIVAFSPNCVILVVSNPVDIMSHVTATLSKLPPGRVFGTGTALDSSRFRTLIAEKLHVDSRSVHGQLVGEHGDSSVAVWSGLNIGGVRLRDLSPQLGRMGDAENWAAIHEEVVGAAMSIIKAKGFTNWSIGRVVASLAQAILRNENRIVPVSCPVRGMYGIQTDVFLSLPATIGRSGVRSILKLPLDNDEEEKLRASAAAIHTVQASLYAAAADAPAAATTTTTVASTNTSTARA